MKFSDCILSTDSLKSIKGGYGQNCGSGGCGGCYAIAACSNGSMISCTSSSTNCVAVDQQSWNSGHVQCNGAMTRCPQVRV